jgi:hypothetical protein
MVIFLVVIEKIMAQFIWGNVKMTQQCTNVKRLLSLIIIFFSYFTGYPETYMIRIFCIMKTTDDFLQSYFLEPFCISLALEHFDVLVYHSPNSTVTACLS